MGEKAKNRIITIGFVFIIILIFIANIISKDQKISISERRKLARFPAISMQELTKGNLSDQFEKYAMDQFVERDLLRGLKSFISVNIFRQKDNNNLFIKDNAIYKMEYPLNTKNVQKSADKINSIYEKYLKNMNVYYAIIPEKNHYLSDDDHLKMDYYEVEKIMKNTLENMKYISIEDTLSLNDYYRTDTHWKQENLKKVVHKIEGSMNLEDTSNINYKKEEMGDFYGVYYGQLGMKLEPDKIYILSNEDLDKCTTYNLETKKQGLIYEREKWNSYSDKYDIYLSGATPIITIENPNANTQKELLLFRDSFGSSIAPLLVENYSKITLVDIRYISSILLENYIKFDNQDVLFLYSTLVLNQNILK